MICVRCERQQSVMKTCRWRDDRPGTFALCSDCWLPISGVVWIVPGLVTCFGKCSRCGSWESVRELRDPKPGGRRDAWVGTCPGCVV